MSKSVGVKSRGKKNHLKNGGGGGSDCSSDLMVLPGGASMVHTQCRLCSYGAGYPGDRIRPEGSFLMLPPHSAEKSWKNRSAL